MENVEQLKNSTIPEFKEKKKRGRKSKQEIIEINKKFNNNLNTIEKKNNNLNEETFPKKRGRKPKGGKIVTDNLNVENISDSKINIILHLKCGINDLKKDCEILEKHKNTVENFKFSENKMTDLNYMIYNNSLSTTENLNLNKNIPNNNLNSNYKNNNKNNNISSQYLDLENQDNKTIWQKLEKLSSSLHHNSICDKKSACFHCTYEFDNVPLYIPKYELNKIFHVYGCFCSPECACAYLMNEKNIDTTTRFERYHLLNFLYCKIYNYSKNIKPAPPPQYLLNKFYGNLSIQEYRKLLKNERLLLVVDKPLVRLLPEIHEDSDDFLLNYQGIPPSKYSFSKSSLSKNEILNENFNLKQCSI